MDKYRDDENCQYGMMEPNWGEWHYAIEIDTLEEWKTVKMRNYEVGRENFTVCFGKQVDETLEWLKFVHRKLTWFDAKENCEQLGGHLFYSVNGTKNQLDFLYNKTQDETAWLGIHTDDHINFRNLLGDVIPDEQLYWNPENGADGAELGENWIAMTFYYNERHYLQDVHFTGEFVSICDLL